jgi:trans-aconitate methyltransferase
MSKKWLLDNLQSWFPSGKLIVVGGWIGLLARAINTFPNVRADSLDISQQATEVARAVLAHEGNAILSDMYDFNYDDYQCVVNTSGEHIPDLGEWMKLIKPGTVVVVQSNNARHIPDHINCVDCAAELERSLNLSETLYAGELVFPMYTRYMVIGIK